MQLRVRIRACRETHGEWNKSVNKMSLVTAERVGDWLTERLDTVKPKKLALTFFGGEPLLNLEVLYLIAERAWEATQDRGTEMEIHVITNGLLLTPEVVERLKPLGLEGFKVTLDGDRESHDRMRPLRGGQGTFDKIIENIRQVAPLCNIAIGGNFDEQSVDSYPALLDFLREQSFADSLVKVAFKPIISTEPVAQSNGLIPLTAVDDAGKALGGGCMTAAGAAAAARRATPVTSSTRRCPFCGKRQGSATSRRSTACTWAPARSTQSTRTP